MLRKDKWPELPPHYQYVCEHSRIFISYPNGQWIVRLRVPNSVNEQYWNIPHRAALAAWKHAYEHKGEVK